MSRPASEHYDLSEQEKRDLIKLIEQGKPLPDKYRFMLFADKREVELVWNGKTREVCTAILPFQTLEHIDEPRREKREDEELGLDTGGRQLKGWTNKLIWGDNKLILSSLKYGALPGVVQAGEELLDFEERWTGSYIFENEWQSFRTRQDRDLELTTAQHVYAKPGRYTVAVKVIDIFGNDTMTLVPVTVG